LEFAYTLYVEGLCECGRPKFECRNEANRGLYEVADITCYAQAAVEEYTGQEKFKPDPGQRFYAREIDEELITRRTFGGENSHQITAANDDQSGSQHGEADNNSELSDERDYG
jgi:hypothetical protein